MENNSSVPDPDPNPSLQPTLINVPPCVLERYLRKINTANLRMASSEMNESFRQTNISEDDQKLFKACEKRIADPKFKLMYDYPDAKVNSTNTIYIHMPDAKSKHTELWNIIADLIRLQHVAFFQRAGIKKLYEYQGVKDLQLTFSKVTQNNRPLDIKTFIENQSADCAKAFYEHVVNSSNEMYLRMRFHKNNLGRLENIHVGIVQKHNDTYTEIINAVFDIALMIQSKYDFIELVSFQVRFLSNLPKEAYYTWYKNKLGDLVCKGYICSINPNHNQTILSESVKKIETNLAPLLHFLYRYAVAGVNVLIKTYDIEDPDIEDPDTSEELLGEGLQSAMNKLLMQAPLSAKTGGASTSAYKRTDIKKHVLGRNRVIYKLRNKQYIKTRGQYVAVSDLTKS